MDGDHKQAAEKTANDASASGSSSRKLVAETNGDGSATAPVARPPKSKPSQHASKKRKKRRRK